MAKIFILIFAAFFSSSSFALSFNFDNAPLEAVIKYVVRDLLKRDYVLSKDLPLSEKVTFKLTDVKTEDLIPALNNVLSAFEIGIRESRGVLIVSRARGDAFEPSDNPPGAAPVLPSSLSPVVPGQLKDMPENLDQKTFDDVEVYIPRYRSAKYLSVPLSLLGCRVAGSAAVSQSVTPSAVYAGRVPVQVPGAYLNTASQSGAVVMPLQSPTTAVDLDQLVFSCAESKKQKALSMLEKLDVAVPVVQIEAAVFEMTKGTDSQRSLNVVANLLKNKLGLVLDVGAASRSSLSITTPDFSALLTAVDGDSRFRFLSRPSVRVADGQKSVLTVGQEVPTRGAISYDQTGNVIQSIEYRTAGLMLDVAAKVFNQSIALDIKQQISSFTSTSTSGIDSPTILKRELSSVVRVRDGDVLVLAGLDENRSTDNKSGVAFLPDFLAAKSSVSSDSQIVIFMSVKLLDE